MSSSGVGGGRIRCLCHCRRETVANVRPAIGSFVPSGSLAGPRRTHAVASCPACDGGTGRVPESDA